MFYVILVQYCSHYSSGSDCKPDQNETRSEGFSRYTFSQMFLLDIWYNPCTRLDKSYYTPSGKKKILNECWEKPQKFMCMSNVLAFLSKPERTFWSLIPQLLSLVQRLRYVHHSQATPISYTFLVADYWSSTATLSYKQLWQFGEVRT